jgi:hypothetical protein
MNVYKHYRPRSIIFPVIVFGILGVAGLCGFVWSLSRGLSSEPPPFVFLFPIVIAVVNGWIMGGVAIEACLTEDGYVEFTGPLLRKVKVSVLDIVSIAPSEMSQMHTYVVRHRNGRFRVDGRLNGMHELIGKLKSENPAIDLRGI